MEPAATDGQQSEYVYSITDSPPPKVVADFPHKKVKESIRTRTQAQHIDLGLDLKG
jgi:hypothetical protein